MLEQPDRFITDDPKNHSSATRQGCREGIIAQPIFRSLPPRSRIAFFPPVK